MDKEILENFLNLDVSLVKDNDFVIWGRISKIYDDCIIFNTDNKQILLTFDRIKEIQPRGHRRYYE